MNNYKELLLSNEWKQKREEIIGRDDSQCRKCKNERLFSDRLIKVAFVERDNLQHVDFAMGLNVPNFTRVKFQRSRIIHELLQQKDLLIYYQDKELYNSIQLIREATTKEYQVYKIETDNYLLKKREDYNLKGNKYQFAKEYLNDTLFLDRICTPVAFTLEELENIQWFLVKGLNVHHTFYQEGLKPWQYPNKSLITYCQPCHEELHFNEKIPRLNLYGQEIGTLTPCGKCAGSGWIPRFKHVEGGICFECWGAKYKEFISSEKWKYT